MFNTHYWDLMFDIKSEERLKQEVESQGFDFAVEIYDNYTTIKEAVPEWLCSIVEPKIIYIDGNGCYESDKPLTDEMYKYARAIIK